LAEKLKNEKTFEKSIFFQKIWGSENSENTTFFGQTGENSRKKKSGLGPDEVFRRK
jgi:hypothetical protein